MSRRIQSIVSGAVFAVFGAIILCACGPTFTPEEANDACVRLRNDLPACFNDAVFDECVACHEECGRDCSLLESSTGCLESNFVCD